MAFQRLFKGFSIDSFYYFAATTVGRNSRNNGCAASALRRHHHDRRGCFSRWDRRGNELAHGPSANTRHRNIPAYASQVWGHVQLHGLRVDVGAIRRCGMRRAASLRLAGARALSRSATSKHAHKGVTHAVQYPSFRRLLRKEQGPRPKQPLAPRPKQLLAPRLFGWNILRRLIWMLPALRRSQSARRCGEAPA